MKWSVLQRKRICLAGVALAALFLLSYPLLPHFGLIAGISEANGRTIVQGMTLQQVEAILGTPNSLPDLTRTAESFWDENTLLGSRYVAIHVTYDVEERVAHTRVRGFWRRPLWLPKWLPW